MRRVGVALTDQDCEVLVDDELCPSIQTALRNFFLMLEVSRQVLTDSCRYY